MDVCPACSYERGYKTNDIIESSKKVITKSVWNYVDCKWPSLATEPCQDRSCDNFFHLLCQNGYNRYDQIYGLEKRYKLCVDKMIKLFFDSLKMSSDKEVKKHMIRISSFYFK